MTLIKRTTSIIGIFCLIALLVTSVQAAENGVLYVTNASDVEPDSSSTVRIYLDNAFEPPCGAAQFKLYYNNSIIQADSVSVTTGGVVPKNLQSPITFAFATTSGIPNGDAWLANITFKALNTDGSTSELGLTLEELNDIAIPPKSLTSTCRIQNGTFSTRNVPVLPVANFTANVTAGTAPLAVRFTDTSTGNPTAWLWSFGDGATSTEQNPSHIYTAAGVYTVRLNASNAHGYSISAPTTITVLEPPAAAFTANVTRGNAPLAVQFADKSAGNVTAWSWVFGDGATSAERSPIHTHATAGVYTVRLNASNAYGYSISAPTTITVLEPLVANFTANTTTGPAPLAVQFNDTSTGNPTAWLWDFGDGATSTEQNPVHTYTAPGNYTVNLTVSSGAGSDVISRPGYITVTRVRGDLNGDGDIDISDVSRVAYMVVGKVPADPAADFNGNGKVDIGDAAKIACFIVGKIGEL